MNHEKRVRDRLTDLSNHIWDCERCKCNGSMQLRRSSLNEEFMADDIGLKCSECYYYATHGVAFNDPKTFRAELADRGKRVLDFTEEENKPVKERLENLGYLAKSKTI